MTGKRRSALGAGRGRRKRSAITREEKLGIIQKWEGGQKLSAIAREVRHPPVSTVSTMRGKRLSTKRSALKSPVPVTTMQRQGAISEMETLLTDWIEDMSRQGRIQQEKSLSLCEEFEEKTPEAIAEGSFGASRGGLRRHQKRANVRQAAPSALELKEEQLDSEVPEDIQVTIGEDEGEALPGVGELAGLEALVAAGRRAEPRFTAEGLAEAFRLVDASLSKIESMDPNVERFVDFSRRIYADLSAYRRIQKEKKLESTQCTLDTFIRKLSEARAREPAQAQPSASASRYGQAEGPGPSAAHC
ncbi:uncharacterized protein LOC108938324 isoform X2 [Scleropages formosus]|uniref:uncharacterized protein LOC108938324 isoform X2 n=1 Tax=Scleropages formosus TaxID=113540 RepID=UPI0010FA7915|nr:uncharacterized protein LOC108938324 isoform X2 [Scleropages formosus]